MNSVSGCCLKPIETGAKREYPLGGSTWYETVKVDYCTGCGCEVEEAVLVHSCCGLEICDCDDEACYAGMIDSLDRNFGGETI